MGLHFLTPASHTPAASPRPRCHGGWGLRTAVGASRHHDPVLSLDGGEPGFLLAGPFPIPVWQGVRSPSQAQTNGP